MQIRQAVDEAIISLLPTGNVSAGSHTTGRTNFDDIVKQAVDDTLDSLDQPTLDSAIRAFKINPTSVPPELDRPTLGRLKSILKRELTDDERRHYRQRFRAELANL